MLTQWHHGMHHSFPMLQQPYAFPYAHGPMGLAMDTWQPQVLFRTAIPAAARDSGTVPCNVLAAPASSCTRPSPDGHCAPVAESHVQCDKGHVASLNPPEHLESHQA